MLDLGVFFMLVAAGAAIVGQNILMVQISGSVPTVLIPLAMNAGVGLVSLLLCGSP